MQSSDPVSRIGLGTAQFGSDYGITNRRGQVGEVEAAAILALATDSGIDTIDTARLYGNSEGVLGRTLPQMADFRIVTKTGKFGSAADAHSAVQQLHAQFAESLDALRRRRVDALLIHDPSDLTGPLGPALWAGLEELKGSGRVGKIGVSVYDAGEIDRILDAYAIDIIQVPFNAIDFRLVRGGQFEQLANAGVEIHARSIFLQGLLLAPTKQIASEFEPIRSAVQRLDSIFAEHGLSRLAGLLAVVFSEPAISRFIIGVTSAEELAGIILAAQQASRVKELQASEDAGIDGIFLNPARWGELAAGAGEKDEQ